MKALLTLLLFLLTVVGSFAQQRFTVSGRLVDAQRQPVAFAAVALLAADSSMVASTQSSATGVYQLTGVPAGTYRVQAAALGFGKSRSAWITVGQNLTVPDLTLTTTTHALAEVQVVGRKPLLEMQAGKMIVNVAGSLTAGATALEALQKVPGLVVMNDRLSLAGREGLIIMIDGRTTQYTDVVSVLRDFPSSNIERIEVSTQPDASKDAAGSAGIINIILKKNTSVGTNGTLTLGAGYGRFGKGNAGLDLTHQNTKLSLYGNYSYARRKTYEQLNTERQAPEAEARYEQQSYQPRLANVHTFRTGADYSLSKRQTLGVLLNGYTNRTTVNAESGTVAGSGAQVVSMNDTRRQTDSYAANLNYRLQVDTLGRELTADANYSRYRNDLGSDIANSIRDERGNQARQQLRNDQNTAIELQNVRLDYVWPLLRGTKLGLGVKTSRADIESDLQLTAGQQSSLGRADSFRYSEQIHAGYGQLDGSGKSWSWQAGLRAEQTRTSATSLADNHTVARNYTQLFPSLSVDRSLTKAVALNAAYSRRIDRPSYQDLNPSIVYLDPYTSQRGNSFLKPQFTNSYKLGLLYNKQPFLLVGYSRTHDAISLVTATEDSAIYSTTANLDRLDRYSATLNLPLNLGKLLTGYAGVNVFYNQYLSQYLGSTYRTGRTAATFYGQANVKLPAHLSFEASGYFQTSGLNGLIRFRSFGALNLGVQKTLLQERATLRLAMNDVLFTAKQRGTIRYQALDVDFLSYGESRQVRLSFSYKLGNQQLKALRKRTTGLEEEKGRVKSEKE
ncbi:TonB-dependent receptor domain-containing protein [Hymenobacter chitinivorans]|uniref:Outer membrane receptor protein involved in Fe transport n=1 Tax=Hymenobacter chitinivorans DSM 11115 TaxID=1121954 RepID=A0A2M9B9S4_9BACT|nr:TonB-dependent receptor [Hymenobacter chitinivorans]PJJ54688.1 outer membrane receptor protein involved in Fe transport [Hymenobacter chitinivorans DSM 11115]